MVLEAVKKVTRAEFADFMARPENAERKFELIDGEIIETVPTYLHGGLIVWIGYFIANWLAQFPEPVGWVATDADHELTEDDENSRRPDVSYFQAREGREVVEEGVTPFMPDLAVEIQSPRDSVPFMRRHAAYYLSKGVLIVWLFYPQKKLVEVYRANGDIEFVQSDGVLDGGDVLPGLKIDVSELWKRAGKR